MPGDCLSSLCCKHNLTPIERQWNLKPKLTIHHPHIARCDVALNAGKFEHVSTHLDPQPVCGFIVWLQHAANICKLLYGPQSYLFMSFCRAVHTRTFKAPAKDCTLYRQMVPAIWICVMLEWSFVANVQ